MLTASARTNSRPPTKAQDIVQVLKKAHSTYRRKYPKKYAFLQQVRHAFEVVVPQFPEACCPHATCFLTTHVPEFNIMNGFFRNDAMPRKAFHLWIFDLEAKVHIDITADQFPTDFGSKVVIVPLTKERVLQKLGYSLGDLTGFEEVIEGTLSNCGNHARYMISGAPKRYMSDIIAHIPMLA